MSGKNSDEKVQIASNEVVPFLKNIKCHLIILLTRDAKIFASYVQ